MVAPPPGDGGLVFSQDDEDPYARIGRGGIAFAAAVALALPAAAYLEGDLLSFAACTLFFAFLVVLASVGKRRSLVLRNHDLFTIGSVIDEPVRWDSLAAIETRGTHVELIPKQGRPIHLALGFLGPVERKEAISRMQRVFAVFQTEGPLVLHSADGVNDPETGLRLRSWGPRDRDLAVALAISAENARFQLDDSVTKEAAEAVFAGNVAHFHTNSLWRKYTIESDGTSVGAITLFLNDPILRHALLGIDLLPEHCGRGLGTSAMRALVGFLVKESNLVKIVAGCFADNDRCRRALEKVGFRHVGTLSRFWYKEGAWKSGEWFELDLTAVRRNSTLAGSS